ncbi:MAG: type II secretion system GspH family protein [Synergistaceae bacterium]|jgi:prepilin-type N-terminal cleavage/methylation domain-containing protein|nr:type II secretion system GspH family protein [Synergistaceae bacterium]
MVFPKALRDYRAAERGFSLVEVLMVVLIMGILAGVLGSLMGGFVSGFEVTDDQSIARRRAQDVFNILQVPILSAGLGLPTDDIALGAPETNNAYYFTVNYPAPITGWYGPVEVIDNNFSGEEDALRLVYSVFSGVKYNGSDPVDTFGGDPDVLSIPSVEFSVTSPLPEGYDGITFAAGGPTYSVHSYITFPGMGMHPILVTGTGASPNTIAVSGRKPHFPPPPSGDVVEKGFIRPYHDIYLVRAGVAYVDDESTFCFADITSDDISGGTLPRASALRGAAYRVEGIKAMRVEVESAANRAVNSVTVFVVAEGDNSVTGRHDSRNTPSQAFRTNYPGVTFDQEMYYEEFQMRWRTRNVEPPEQ